MASQEQASAGIGRSFFQVNTKQDDSLKMIGILSMIIDHIGLLFFPGVEFLRIIGRMAFPIFAFGIAKGYKRTSNFQQYTKRLLVFALISQGPYLLMVDNFRLNILFTLLLSILFIYAFDKKRYVIGVLVVLFAILVPIDYGIYGIAMAFLFYYLDSRSTALIVWQVIFLFCYYLETEAFVQFYGLIGIMLATHFPEPEQKIKIPRAFFYWFYPAHISALMLLKYIIG